MTDQSVYELEEVISKARRRTGPTKSPDAQIAQALRDAGFIHVDEVRERVLSDDVVEMAAQHAWAATQVQPFGLASKASQRDCLKATRAALSVVAEEIGCQSSTEKTP